MQGKAVENALHGLGWNTARDVRIGRIIEMSLAGEDPLAARVEVEAMCDKLLANPVIESYRVDIAP